MSTESTHPHSISCPSRAILLAFDSGTLGPHELTSVERHLADCPECDRQLSDLAQQSDSIVRALAMLPVQAEDEPAYQELVSQLREMNDGVTTGPTLNRLLETDVVGEDRTDVDRDFPELPARLGEYELVARLGSGATGHVYKARHLKLDRWVVVKVLKETRRAAIDEFLDEMRRFGRLDHPNIIRGTDAGEVDGHHYLVMEYVGGWDLSRLVGRVGPLGFPDLCRIGDEAAAALQAAHRHGLVHRDVKPSNLLLSRQGSVKLLDLGLAVDRDEATAVPRGTADYMAPEQWEPAPTNRTGPQTDVYGLGCTLFTLATGEPPFRQSRVGRRRAHVAEIPIRIDQLRPESPVPLAELIAAMLQKEGTKRPSLEEVRSVLQPLGESSDLERLARFWIPYSVDDPTTTFQGEPCAEATPATQPASVQRTRQPTRRAAVALGLGGTLAGLVALRIGRPWRPRQTQREIWRSLLDRDASRPKVMVAEQPGQTNVKTDYGRQQVIVNGPGSSCVVLGRPLLSPFRLRTAIVAEAGHQAGIFFAGRVVHRKNSRPGTHLWTCHALTVAPHRPGPEFDQPSSATIRWQQIEWPQGDTVAPVSIETWATTLAPSWHHANQIELRLGRRGIPEVVWNQREVPEDAWHGLTWQAQEFFQRKQPSALATIFMGLFGFYGTGGMARYITPELQYEA